METEIIVDNRDLLDYYTTTKRDGKVLRFKRLIHRNMPKEIKKEFRSKFNDLVRIGDNIFKFKAKDCSDELSDYLGKFTIVVNDNR